MFSGLHYLHSNFIIHRDLKPDNFMFAADGTLKFIDFGMAKKFGEELPLSKNLMALCYRPPEILFGGTYYGPSADMWSMGCIFAELLMKRPLFGGGDIADQLNKIFTIRGTPDQDPDLKKSIHILEKYLHFTPPTKAKEWKDLFPNESD